MIDKQDVKIPRGNTRVIHVPVTRGGDPYDMTDHQFFYSVVTADGTVIIDFNDTDNPTKVGLRTGFSTEVEIVLSNVDTDISPVKYRHELEIRGLDGSRWDVMQGSLEILPSRVYT